jgi:hypothetical protein
LGAHQFIRNTSVRAEWPRWSLRRRCDGALPRSAWWRRRSPLLTVALTPMSWLGVLQAPEHQPGSPPAIGYAARDIAG